MFDANILYRLVNRIEGDVRRSVLYHSLRRLASREYLFYSQGFLSDDSRRLVGS